MHYKNYKRSKSRLAQMILSFSLIFAIAITSFISVVGRNIASAAEIDADSSVGTITQWKVAGSFNGWASSTDVISGSSGSITLDFSSYIGKAQTFKVIATENGNDIWCGNNDGAITFGTAKELTWGEGGDLSFTPTASSITFTVSVSNGKNYVTVTQNSSEDPTTPYVPSEGEVHNAVAGSSIANNDSLYQISATFYDYYTDTEVSNGWRTSEYVNSHGDWEPYTTLNTALRNYAQSNNVKYPLYFGNFYGKADGYAGYNNSTNYNFINVANNSSGLNTQYYGSVVGLTSKSLDSNGMLCYYGTNDSTQGAVMPIFDSGWLTSNGLGTTVQTNAFPMRITTKNGATYYEFDSNNGTDNVRFENYSGDMTIEYGAGTSYAIYDALSNYGGSSNGIGFFPFDYRNSHSDHTNDAWDYGFGMRVDIPFNVGVDGKIDGVSQLFEFSGDDDVWVFIDGELVLDLGGDHKMATGSINFNTKTATVTTGTQSLESVTRNGAFEFDNQDPTQTHTLTMFYMERGMIESNLKFGFNFSPVGNQLVSTKTVDATNVNSGIQSAVESADSFTFNAKTSETESGTYSNATNKTYTGNQSSGSTGTNGNYSLKDGGTVNFNDQFTTGEYIRVVESESSPLTYNTTWSATDTVTGDSLGSGTGVQSQFRFLTTDTESSFAATRVQLDYVNTPQVDSIDVSKVVYAPDGTTVVTTDSTEFNAVVTVSLDGGTTYSAYPLTYTASDKSGTFTLTSSGNLSSDALLKSGRTLTFAGLPIGAKVKVVESSVPATHSYVGVSSSAATVGTDSIVTVSNKQVSPDDVSVPVKVAKVLSSGDEYITFAQNSFAFELHKDSVDSTPIQTVYVSEATENTNFTGYAEFSYLTFSEAGTYTYYINEVQGTDADIEYNTSVIRLVIVINYDTSTNRLSIGSVTYYDSDGTQLSKNINYAPEFENVVKTGEVSIVKKDNTNNLVQGAKFTVFKIANDSDFNNLTADDLYDYENDQARDENVVVKTITTGADGKATLSGLQIYKSVDSEIKYDSSNKHYQGYAIVETYAPDGMNLNKTVQFFKFPTSNSYKLTYDYVNTFTLLPDTSGNGLTPIKVVGLCITGFAGLLMGGYLLRSKKFSKKRVKLEK